ncbi:hypothetical protein [Thermus sp.]
MLLRVLLGLALGGLGLAKLLYLPLEDRPPNLAPCPLARGVGLVE